MATAVFICNVAGVAIDQSMFLPTWIAYWLAIFAAQFWGEAKMKIKFLGALAALISVLATSLSAEAAVMNVSKIRVTNNLAHSGTLQVNEIIALVSGTGTDAALASAGATVTSSPPLGHPFYASNVIDGLISTGHNFYHGAFSPTDFVEVMLATSMTLESITIIGRLDCCMERDSYILQLFNAAGGLLFTEELDGRNAGAAGVTSQLRVSEVPLPAALPLMVGGLGLLGFFGWRRKRLAADV